MKLVRPVLVIQIVVLSAPKVDMINNDSVVTSSTTNYD